MRRRSADGESWWYFPKSDFKGVAISGLAVTSVSVFSHGRIVGAVESYSLMNKLDMFAY